MTDESERPGEAGIRGRSADEEREDTEGHAGRFKFGTPDTDKPPADEAEAEGHGLKGKFGMPDGDQLPGDGSEDTEGHMPLKRGAAP
jgi:hypothetical protein